MCAARQPGQQAARFIGIDRLAQDVAIQIDRGIGSDDQLVIVVDDDGTDMVKSIREDVLAKIVGTIPVKRLGEPSEIASIIAWLASEEGGYSTGADFSVNGGLHMG